MRNKDKFYMADSFDRGVTMNWMAEDCSAVSALNCCASVTAASYKDILTAVEGITGQGTSSNCYGYTANNLSIKGDNGNWVSVSSIGDRVRKLEETVKELFDKNKKYAGSRGDSDLRSRLVTLRGSM